MKTEAINHTKMERLMRRLDVPRYAAAGIMELLWKTAAREAPAGDIGKLRDGDIANHVDWKGSPGELVSALVEAGWIDEHPVFRLVIHDQRVHCEDFVHAKISRVHGYFVDGLPPKLCGLRKNERAAADAFYAAHPEAPWRKDMQPVANPLSTDNLAKPSRALPSQAEPGESEIAPDPVVVPAKPEPVRQVIPATVIDFPKPKPEATNPIANIPEDFDFDEWFDDIYRRHPFAKKRQKGLAQTYCVEALQTGKVDPNEITRVHRLCCETENWRWKGGANAPTLAQWILDNGWESPPPAEEESRAPMPPGRATRANEIEQRIVNATSNR